MIVNNLKKRIEGAKGSLVDKLPNILWAYRTTPRRSIGKMPFSMTYGIEAVIPVKISLSSSKVANFAQGHNDEDMVSSLNALEERRDMVSIQLSSYQQRLA